MSKSSLVNRSLWGMLLGGALVATAVALAPLHVEQRSASHAMPVGERSAQTARVEPKANSTSTLAPALALRAAASAAGPATAAAPAPGGAVDPLALPVPLTDEDREVISRSTDPEAN